MVAWFIIAIATLAVFALIAVNGVQTVAATTDGVGRVETTRRVEAAVAAITARTGSPNNTGKAMVVAGSTVDGIYGLPAELSAFASTPFGQRIVYCPFGDGESGTASSVPSGGGATYPIEVKADATGRVFVTAGRPNFPQVADNANLMAFVIAPRTKSSGTPTCNSVRFNPTTSRFEAPDAIVRPVIRASAGEDQRQQAGREVIYYVSPTGSGRGLAPNDPTSMYSAITYYRSALPQAMRIVMATGTYNLPAQYMNSTVGGFSDKGNSGTLVIEGANSQLDFNGPSDVWVPGHLELRNLTVSSAVGLYAEQGHRLTLLNTTTGFLNINNGGNLQATNVAITDTRLGYGVRVNAGSTASFSGNVTVRAAGGSNGIGSMGGSRVVFDSSAVVVSAASGTVNWGVFSEENSDVVFRLSTITFPSTALASLPFYVKGRTTVTGGSITVSGQVTNMFIIEGGGYLSYNSPGLGGVPPVNGINDNGASGVTGAGIVRASSVCWTGTQFSRSNSGNGTNSRVTDTENVGGMSPNPTAGEVQANADVTARNAQRAQLRSTNTSNFTCQI